MQHEMQHKNKKPLNNQGFLKAADGNRTRDLRTTNATLYRLSHSSLFHLVALANLVYIITVSYTHLPVTVTVQLNAGAAQEVTVNADGTFSKGLTLASGANTITVVATDSAGKSTTVTRTVTLDTTAPQIKSVTITPNPVDSGKTYVISVEVTD